MAVYKKVLGVIRNLESHCNNSWQVWIISLDHDWYVMRLSRWDWQDLISQDSFLAEKITLHNGDITNPVTRDTLGVPLAQTFGDAVKALAVTFIECWCTLNLFEQIRVTRSEEAV